MERVRIFSLLCLLSFNFGVSEWSWANGTWGSSGSERMDVYQEVEGRVRFKKRHVLIPMNYCEDGPCYPSSSYWTLVLETVQGRFEVNQKFSVGLLSPPSEILLAGLSVEDGMRVVVEGRVLPIAPGYSLIADVQAAHLTENPK